LVSFTRTADKKTTYSTFCRAMEFRAVHPHSLTAPEIYIKRKTFTEIEIAVSALLFQSSMVG
jgi:hypothetical protein